jgi:hypothetical protein
LLAAQYAFKQAKDSSGKVRDEYNDRAKTIMNMIAELDAKKPSTAENETEFEEAILFEEPSKVTEITTILEAAMPKTDQVDIEVLEKNICLFPDEKPVIEFWLSKKFDKVYVKVDGKTYNCYRRIRNWVTEGLDISSGNYLVEVLADGVVGSFEVAFNGGIAENDLGLF